MTRTLQAVDAAALTIALVGCSGTSSTSTRAPRTPAPKPTTECSPLSADNITAITEGAKPGVTLDQGVTLPLPDDLKQGPYTRVAAVKMDNPDDVDDTALFILGDDPLTAILAAGAVTQLYFTWGEAATDGSPIDDYRKSVFTSRTMSQAKACLP